MQNTDVGTDDLSPLAGSDAVSLAVKSSTRPGDRAFVGCLWVAGVVGIALFFYLGFFAFALVDYWNEWRLLDPYLDERTSEILYVIYWPLIHLSLFLGLD